MRVKGYHIHGLLTHDGTPQRLPAAILQQQEKFFAEGFHLALVVGIITDEESERWQSIWGFPKRSRIVIAGSFRKKRDAI